MWCVKFVRLNFFFLKTIWECCCSKHQDSPACIKEKEKEKIKEKIKNKKINLSLKLGQIMFRRLTHLQKNCMMVHFSFQYRWNITQNLFLSSFPLVHNSTYWCIWAGAPARKVGWCDPGFIHASFLNELWPNAVYVVSLFLHMMLNLGVNSEKLRFWSNFYAEEQNLHCYAFIGTYKS